MQQHETDRQRRIEAARERLRGALRRYALAEAVVEAMNGRHAGSPERAGTGEPAPAGVPRSGAREEPEGRGTSDGQGRSSGH